jgi:nucleotide-binding universal stress UspA family protein
MDIDTVLVPIAGTDTSAGALRYAVSLAEQYDAQIHALYVLDSEEADDRGEQLMVATRAAAGDVPLSYSSMYGFSTEHLTHHPGSVVLDVSNEVNADCIVISREGSEGSLGMAADYVVQYASEPVLSV